MVMIRTIIIFNYGNIEHNTCKTKHKPILLASSGLLNNIMFSRSLPGRFKLLGLNRIKNKNNEFKT